MQAAILYSEKMKDYDLGHVLTGERYESFMRLFREKLGNNPVFEIIEPGYATEADLKLVHTEEYIRRVERCESRDPHDTPLSPAVVRAAKLMAGASKLNFGLSIKVLIWSYIPGPKVTQRCSHS